MNTTNQPRFIVAQLGARRHYAVPAALYRAEMLERIYTDLSSSTGSLRALSALWPEHLRPRSIAQLLDRRISNVPPEKITPFTTFGLQRVLRRHRLRNPAERLRDYLAVNKEFNRLVLRADWKQGNAVYAFNAAALEIFQQAKEVGFLTVLDQTTAPWAVEESLLAEEREKWPGWETGGATEKDWTPLAERERGEWALADLIVCGSEFVKQGIQSESGPVEKTVVIPYGIDTTGYKPFIRKAENRPLHVLFAGTVQLRKGIQYLLEAARNFAPNEAEFRAVGSIAVTPHAEHKLRQHIDLIGSVPRSRMRDHYAWADILALPSLSEGSANVAYEALANGLPVIATPNSGTIIHDGENGYIVPVRNPEALREKIKELADHPQHLAELSGKAQASCSTYTTDVYAKRLIEVIMKAIQQHPSK